MAYVKEILILGSQIKIFSVYSTEMNNRHLTTVNHFLSTSYMPGAVLSILHALTQFSKQFFKVGVIISHYRGGN